jgi:ferredoxin--NADP+ reductase
MDALATRRTSTRAPAAPGDPPIVRPRPALEPNTRLGAREDLTPTVARLVVVPDDEVGPFEPGQYFALGLSVDGRPLLRPYSTASPRGSKRHLEFLVRLVPDGAFTPRLWELRVGDRLWIGRPKGLFTLRPGDPRTHLFVATGTGLAPFVSMVETLLRDDAGGLPSGPSGTAHVTETRAIVVHGVSHVAELAYRDRLERLASSPAGVRYLPVVSRPSHPDNAGWRGLIGRLDAQLDAVCAAHRLDPAASVAYLCGNPEMIATAERILARRGFAPDAVVSEHYWPLA